MSKHDISYFEFRAESELELAQRATHPKAVKAHYQLAEMYLDKIYGPFSDEEDSDSPANDAGSDGSPQRAAASGRGSTESSGRQCA